MCGITGIVSLSSSKDDLTLNLQRMTNLIWHRGPDGNGYMLAGEEGVRAMGGDDTPESVSGSQLPYAPEAHIATATGNFSVGFGHRRLAILDLSESGHQPMCNKDRNLWITYNGEVYNYKEIKEELSLLGHRFVSETDTEVILNAYREWGPDCVEKFNGMWAFVIYDHDKKQLFGSRDRFGVKPFYYFHNSEVFAFASEQKALLGPGLAQPAINPSAVFDFFMRGQMEYEQEGFFKGILELFPAHSFTLKIESNEFKQWTYYELPVNTSYESFSNTSFKVHSETIREKLLAAVATRLQADVRVGSCLSGGIDSSTIVGIAADQLNQGLADNIGNQLEVFTATFNDKKLDESAWAEKMVNATGASWHQVTPTSSELLSDLDDLLYSQDIPIWSTSTYAQFRVMKLVKEAGIKVVLDGQGADELFAGYDNYVFAWWNELVKNNAYGRLNRELMSFKSLPASLKFWAKQRLLHQKFPKMAPHRQIQVSARYYDDIHWLNRNFLEENKQRLVPQVTGVSGLNMNLHREFYNSRLKTYLRCEDRCSMWHSVESRTPFADDLDLIEASFAIPAAYKIKRSVKKLLLREAAGPFIPDEIKNRKDKMGYAIPNNPWITDIKDDLKDIFTDDLSEYLNVNGIKKNFDQIFDIRSKPENTSRVFKLIAFAKWKQLFIK